MSIKIELQNPQTWIQRTSVATSLGRCAGTRSDYKTNSQEREYGEFSSYQNATTDYSSKLGDRELYRRYYREGFENGYQDGWNGY